MQRSRKKYYSLERAWTPYSTPIVFNDEYQIMQSRAKITRYPEPTSLESSKKSKSTSLFNNIALLPLPLPPPTHILPHMKRLLIELVLCLRIMKLRVAEREVITQRPHNLRI